MLLDPSVELRIVKILEAVASAFSTYSIGKELRQAGSPEILAAFAPSSGMSSLSGFSLTYLETSYLAGKAASMIGLTKLKAMSESELTDWVRTHNLTLTSGDKAILDGLRADTERSISARLGVWQQRVREAISSAETQWQTALALGKLKKPEVETAFRSEMLDTLGRKFIDIERMNLGELMKVSQTEMSMFFQRGQVALLPGDTYVYKVPRPAACSNCLRVHLNKNGTPKMMKLSDVLGESNRKTPAPLWTWTLGPLHPYCYCELHVVGVDGDGKFTASEFSELATLRKQALRKSVAPKELHSAHDVFEGGLLPPHHLSLINSLRKIYGDGPI